MDSVATWPCSHCAQSHCEPLLRRGKVWAAQPFPLPKRHLLAQAGKVRDDSKAAIPNLCLRTTETRVYAGVRTRTKSTETFCVGKKQGNFGVLALLRTEKSFFYANLVKGVSDIISLSSTYLHSHRRRAGQEQILLLESRGQECSARGSSVAAPPHTQGCLSLGEGTNTQGEPWSHISWTQSMWGAQWSHTTVKLSAGPSENKVKPQITCQCLS